MQLSYQYIYCTLSFLSRLVVLGAVASRDWPPVIVPRVQWFMNKRSSVPQLTIEKTYITFYTCLIGIYYVVLRI